MQKRNARSSLTERKKKITNAHKHRHTRTHTHGILPLLSLSHPQQKLDKCNPELVASPLLVRSYASGWQRDKAIQLKFVLLAVKASSPIVSKSAERYAAAFAGDGIQLQATPVPPMASTSRASTQDGGTESNCFSKLPGLHEDVVQERLGILRQNACGRVGQEIADLEAEEKRGADFSAPFLQTTQEDPLGRDCNSKDHNIMVQHKEDQDGRQDEHSNWHVHGRLWLAPTKKEWQILKKQKG